MAIGEPANYVRVKRRWAVAIAAAGALAMLLALVSGGQYWAAFLGFGVAVGAAAIALRDEELAPAPAVTSSKPATPTLMQLAPLLEALPDPALLVDMHWRVVVGNAPARRKFGFPAEGGQLSSITRHPDLLDAVHAAVHSGEAGAVDYEMNAPAKEYFRCFVAPLSWAQSTAALIVFHDETTRINTERMRADFLANASHELRTPLAALTLMIETLSGHARNDPEAQARFLRQMGMQAEKMRRLIGDLLSLSKIELDEHVPPADKADLAAIAREAVETLTPAAVERGVVLNLSGATEAPCVGDRFQLAQVAQNLIDNAVKYSSRGDTVAIEVGLADDREEALAKSGRRSLQADRISVLNPPPAPGRRYTFLRVADMGPGIPRSNLPRLSERFYRVERDQTAERAGTGLGLAIVKHIINRHRGGFVVESQFGAGAAFAIYVQRPQSIEMESASDERVSS